MFLSYIMHMGTVETNTCLPLFLCRVEFSLLLSIQFSLQLCFTKWFGNRVLKIPFNFAFGQELQPLMVLPPRTPTPPHARAVSCDFDIDASTYDSGMISTVWLSRDFAHYIHWEL